MAFGQGVVVTGGYRSCPEVQCEATVTTALTAQPPFSLHRLEHTHWCISDLLAFFSQLHASVSICAPPCSLFRAVSKVGKPRRGYRLVEFVILVWKWNWLEIGGCNHRACSCIHMAH